MSANNDSFTSQNSVASGASDAAITGLHALSQSLTSRATSQSFSQPASLPLS
jgi:hypothetical protein